MRWEFKQEPGEPHRWRWQCIDETLGSTLKVSPVPFRTLSECIKDAEKHGYIAPRLSGGEIARKQTRRQSFARTLFSKF
jgi:hypothetical protein